MSVAVTVTSMDRANLEEHKARLTSTLKDNWVAYWDLLKRYVQSKLSKQELDAQARVLLGEENGSLIAPSCFAPDSSPSVNLHNQFFLALLQNVHAAIIPKIIISRKDSGLGKDKSKKLLKRKDGSGIQVRSRQPCLGADARRRRSASPRQATRDSVLRIPLPTFVVSAYGLTYLSLAADHVVGCSRSAAPNSGPPEAYCSAAAVYALLSWRL